MTAEQRANLARPATCFHCPAPAVVPSDPAEPATCCADPRCIELEAIYQEALSRGPLAPQMPNRRGAADERGARVNRALAKGRRTFRQVETIADGRLTG